MSSFRTFSSPFRTWMPIATVVTAASLSQLAESSISRGMSLVYSGNGVESPPWIVDSLNNSLSFGGKSGCRYVRFAPGGPRATADVRITCETDGLLYSWDTATAAWRASRPVRVGLNHLTASKSGPHTEYSVTKDSVEVISGLRIKVLHTLVLTYDAEGKMVRRLRERFAPAFGTATGGVFEVADPAAPGGFRVQQSFELVRISPALSVSGFPALQLALRTTSSFPAAAGIQGLSSTTLDSRERGNDDFICKSSPDLVISRSP